MERTRHKAALRVVGGTESDRARLSDLADRELCAALYDTIRRHLPKLDPELSVVRDDLLIAAQHFGNLAGRPSLPPVARRARQ